jgi:hypothetical protein
MGKDNENFRDTLKTLAEISDLFDKDTLIKKSETEIQITLPKERYDKILKNFREIDWLTEEFYIDVSELKFKFVLKK